MTGQKCVYLRDVLGKERRDAFLLQPFTQDFTHNWTHHLSRLKLGMIDVKGTVRRADSVARTGYVMCSRICFPIQQAELILADVTAENLNVFYELGLACALGKRLLLIAHETATSKRVIAFLKAVGLEPFLARYSSAPASRSLSDDLLQKTADKGEKIGDPVEHFRIASQRHATQHDPASVVVFCNEDNISTQSASARTASRGGKIYDLIRAALDGLSERADRVNSIISRSSLFLAERGDSGRVPSITKETVIEFVKALHGGTLPLRGSSSELVETITTADIVLIDTNLNDFETYFWLGLCHGIEQEVIPLSIADTDSQPDAVPGTPADKQVLPFDIRTLWHIGGTFDQEGSIQDQMSNILEEIIARSLAARSTVYRDRFWHPVVHSPRLSFHFGSGLFGSKQVMGEWDLRTFQEIASFVSRSNPNLEVAIEKPAVRKEKYSAADLQRFSNLLRSRMENTHCVIVGGPDVNPVAEVVLAELKGLVPFVEWSDENARLETSPNWTGATAKADSPRAVKEGYVTFKNHLFTYSKPNPTTFFLQFNDQTPWRGLLYHDEAAHRQGGYAARYTPRERMQALIKQHSDFRDLDDSDDKSDPENLISFTKQVDLGGRSGGLTGWPLLGHVVIAPNPFGPDFPQTPWRVILIMGVGGPATLGLAHLLTGRVPESTLKPWTEEDVSQFIRTSEDFLSRMNDLLRTKRAAEAIVTIHIVTSLSSVNIEFEDMREINHIEIARPLTRVENPKAFRFSSRTP